MIHLNITLCKILAQLIILHIYDFNVLWEAWGKLYDFDAQHWSFSAEGCNSDCCSCIGRQPRFIECIWISNVLIRERQQLCMSD